MEIPLMVTSNNSANNVSVNDSRRSVTYHPNIWGDFFLSYASQHKLKNVFCKFLDEKGNFKESIPNNVEGLLELYEASNYGVHGEEILDKALEFSSSNLQSLIMNMSNDSLSTRVREALKIPISKTLNRLGARKFISMYKEDDSCNEKLLDFAMSDFNLVQKLHQKELSHLTRWDMDAIDQLPPCMRIYYKALFDVYVEMEDEMGKQGKSYAVEYGKAEMIRLAEVYLKEAEWSFSKHKPTMEEYTKVALLSSGYVMVSINSLAVIDDPISKEEFDWVLSEPPLLKSSLLITRLMDDLAGYGFEKKLSAIHYYMHENGVSEKEAFAELRKQVKNAWKVLNKELLDPREASIPILKCVANFTRVIFVLYTDEDAYGNSKTKTKDMINSVLVDPLTIL
ncbi:hypothetical protein SASPL_113781 [Salvia splendens]|uniref:Uncharacterized protein n=1 Tax=Salvia splendens TaxID=180675 RepID=A0A8X9A0K7_SALSN|nr:hypothetical protein SASPL_113781 [Salvia splendens]